MRITDLLATQAIHLELRASGKTQLLRLLAGLAATTTGLDAEAILAAIEAREALGSTGVGRGIALPHTHLPGLPSAFVLLARLASPVRFDAVDERPVDLVALALLPAERAAEVNVLGCVARALRDETIAAAVRVAPSPEAVLAALDVRRP